MTVSPLFSALSSFGASAGLAGTFELHLTVASLGLDEQPRFLEKCRCMGVKPVLIHAPGAHMASQPMTSSYLQGTAARVASLTQDLLEALASDHFPVLRCKLEATLGSAGVPETDEEAQAWPERYFEFHAKVLLGSEGEIEPLRRRCLALGAHLSSNAFRVRPDQLQERFLTVRAYRVGRPAALARFRELLGALRRDGYAPGHLLHEYSVLDTNSLLDQGWLALPSPARCLIRAVGTGRDLPGRDHPYLMVASCG